MMLVCTISPVLQLTIDCRHKSILPVLPIFYFEMKFRLNRIVRFNKTFMSWKCPVDIPNIILQKFNTDGSPNGYGVYDVARPKCAAGSAVYVFGDIVGYSNIRIVMSVPRHDMYIITVQQLI